MIPLSLSRDAENISSSGHNISDSRHLTLTLTLTLAMTQRRCLHLAAMVAATLNLSNAQAGDLFLFDHTFRKAAAVSGGGQRHRGAEAEDGGQVRVKVYTFFNIY